MFKRWMIGLVLAGAAWAAQAAVDLNKASQSDLESIKGIGPAVSGKILDERKKAAFKDWPDFIDRVSGVGPGNAARFSEAGLTINGSAYGGAAKPPAKTDATGSAKK